MTGPFPAGRRPTAAALDLAVQKVIGLARRDSDSSVSTSASPQTAVLELPGLAVVAGYLYMVEYLVHLDSTVANDVIEVTPRFTTDGSAPTVSSAHIVGGTITGQAPGNTSHPESARGTAFYPAATSHTLRVLLCHGRIAGTGNCVLHANGTTRQTLLWVWNAGPIVPDTGIDK